MNAYVKKDLRTSRGLSYRYFASTNGDVSKPALLLLHGWPDNAHLWQYVIPHLSSLNLRIIAPDLLGYGGTAKLTDLPSYNYRLMAADVIEILDAENIITFIPVGHDFGCYFTSRINLLYPERCVATVHVGIAYYPPAPNAMDLDAFNALFEQILGYPSWSYWYFFTDPSAHTIFSEHLERVWYALHGVPDDWMQQMFCRHDAFKNFLLGDKTVALKPYARDESLEGAWMADFQTGGWEAPFCWYRACIEDVQLAEDKKLVEQGKGKLDMPVLFIGCDGDAVNPGTGMIEPSKQAGLLPDLTVEALHAGHWCPYETPEELAGMIVKFVRAKGFAGE